MIALSEITKKIQSLQGKQDWYTVLYDLFEVMAIAISNQVALEYGQNLGETPTLFKDDSTKQIETKKV